MFVHLKRRVGVLSAVAVMAALLPVLGLASVASAIPATALAPQAVTNSAGYSACPSGSAAASGFTDTTSTDVDCIAMHGITTGVTATTYEPTANVPRWQMALYLTRMATSAGVTLGSGADQGFTDISGYSAAIQTAINQIKQLGVTVGKTATTYAPDDNVTREEMALFLDRALATMAAGPGGISTAGGNSLLGVNVNSTVTGTGQYNYDDIDGGSVTFEGHNSIVEIYQLGVTGDASTVRAFNPSTAITRAEMATWLTNALAHTNARPAGLWMQVSTHATGFANNSPTLSVTDRDSSRNPVSGTVVDMFEWTNLATLADNAAFTAAGACASTSRITSNSLTKCKVEVGDPTTNTSGNITAFGVTLADATTQSFYAWTAAAGTTFVNATHGSGDDFSTVNASSATAASILLMSTDAPTGAAVGADPFATTVKYGTSITITAQMSAAAVGAVYAPVAQAGNVVTFIHTIEAVAADTVEQVTTTLVTTDANGTATYTFTDADPIAGSAQGDTTHSIVVSDAAVSVLTSAAASTAPGHFMTTGSTVEFDFTDDAIAYNTTSLASNLVSYAAGSALLPVARSVTSTNTDQYGNAHAASAGDTIKFQGAAVSGTGLLSCVDASDLCYFQGARVPSAAGVAVTGAASSNRVTMAGHGLAVGDAVAWATGSTDLLNGDNAVNEVVYVKTVVDVNIFELATVSSGGGIVGLTADIDDCGASPWTNCALYRVESHALTGTESIILRTASTELAGTYTANTRYYVSTAGLTAQEFGLNVTSNATAVMDVVTTPSDDCTLTTCEMFIYHPSATADRTVASDGTASVAWNDTTSTNGTDIVSVYQSTTKEAAKTAYRYVAAAAATTISDSGETAIAWTEDAGNDAGYIDAQPLIWDNANNTLLVKLNHGIANSLVAASTHVAATHVRSVDYVLYSYDDNDQFSLTEGTATTSLAGFELQLTAHMAANAGLAFIAGDLAAVTYQALAGNVSVFKLGT